MSILIEKIKNFWEKNDYKILIVLALLLISVVSFNAGRTYENNIQPAEITLSLNQAPLIASNPRQEKIVALGEAVERSGNIREKIDPSLVSAQINDPDQKECAFIGSKNSDKYHLPTCRYAANIKEENIVCFPSQKEAEEQGYKAASCCVKN